MATLLSDIALGLGGFQIFNDETGTVKLGITVSGAGDFNGDGYEDFVVVAPSTYDLTGTLNAYGRAYVVFGGPKLSSIGLSDIFAGTGGVVIQNDERFQMEDDPGFAGKYVASGDVNGDGLSDIIWAAERVATDTGGDGTRAEIHVIFGQSTSPGPISIADVQAGTGGFTIVADDAPGLHAIQSVATADINNDGFDDVIIGDTNGIGNTDGARRGGLVYVVYGSAQPTQFHLSTLTPADPLNPPPGGFVIFNDDDDGDVVAESTLGSSVASAGDFNGDGIEDIILGDAVNSDSGAISGLGKAFIVLGGSITTPVDLATTQITIRGEDGGDQAGWSVDAAGDINNDGFGDVIIGAPFADGVANGASASGDAYVVFGTATPSSTINLSDIAAGTGGFVLRGNLASERAGTSVTGLGDINQDGYNDFAIGAPYAQNAAGSGGNRGKTYVVYGAANFANEILLADIEAGIGGFVVYGNPGSPGDFLSGLAVDAAGDVDQDGYDDILIGAPQSNVNTVSLGGSAYIVYGSATQAMTLTGTNGKDRLFGGDFDDTLNGKQGADVLDGRGGFDTALFTRNVAHTINLALTGRQNTGEGKDTLVSIEHLILGNGDDTVIGSNRDELFEGRGGSDSFDGRGGSDTVSYVKSKNGVVVDLAANTATGGEAEGDSFARIENLVGTRYEDQLTGTNGSNALSGGNGRDVLKGLAGNDLLDGGTGRDKLTGGADSDTFVLADRASSADRIVGFVSGDDVLQVDASRFGGGLTAGEALLASQFLGGTGNAATTADQRFIFNEATGALFFDADGTGAAAAIRVATFTGGIPALTEGDFLIV